MQTNNLKRVSRRDVFALLAGAGMLGLVTQREDGTPVSPDPSPAFKTIGVLGGLGPQATMDFEVRVHRAAQRLIPQRANGGYPPMIVYYHRQPPFIVNEDMKPRFPIQADPRLLEAARHIGERSDFIVITANGPHLVQAHIEQAARRKVLSLIDVTLEEIQRRAWKKVGVLGFGEPIVYIEPLGKLHIVSETIDAGLRARLDTEIMKVMEGRDDAESIKAAEEAVRALRARNVDGIVLGCTEIPLLLREHTAELDVLNPAELLADTCVRVAAGKEDPWRAGL